MFKIGCKGVSLFPKKSKILLKLSLLFIKTSNSSFNYKEIKKIKIFIFIIT